MENSKKIRILGILLLCICFMTGCGGRGPSNIETAEQGEEYLLRPDRYKKVSDTLAITPGHQPDPYLFSMTDSFCYFGETYREETENKLRYRYAFYRVVRDEEPELMVQGEERVLAFHVSQTTAGDRLCILTQTEDHCIIREYDSEGKSVSEARIEDEVFYDAYPIFLWKMEDGVYYASNRKSLFFIDKEGNSREVLTCPGREFKGGVLNGEGKLYLCYQEKSTNKFLLALMDTEIEKLKDKITLPGNSQIMISAGNTDLLLLLPDGVYRYDACENEVKPILCFTDYLGISADRIWAMAFLDEKVQLLSWKGAKKSARVQIVSFEELDEQEKGQRKAQISEGKRDSFGRERILIYDPSGFAEIELADIAADFNTENDEFFVEFETGSKEINARLIASDSPDIIYLRDALDVKNLYQKGYLENLLPYFQRSSFIPADNLQEFVFSCFGFGDGLYAIPRKGSISTLLGVRAKKGTEGWSVEDFLTWLETSKEINAFSPLTREAVLEYCLLGNMENYVDLDGGEGYFTTNHFQQTLVRIKDFDPGIVVLNSRLEYKEGKNYLVNQPISSIMDISMDECFCRAELIYLGYPCESGKGKTIITPSSNFSILKNSECKEGAYVFLEYMLRYPADFLMEEDASQRSYEGGTIWSLKDLYLAESKGSLGTMSMMYPASLVSDSQGKIEMQTISFDITERHIELIDTMLENAQADTLEYKKIRQIVLEEAEGYFAGHKSLEETCEVIQNRVSLFVQEHTEYGL